MASVDKRQRRQRDGSLGRARWRVRYRTPDRRSRTKTFDRKVDAERFASATEADKSRGLFVDPVKGRVTFAEWYERWLATRVDLRPSTRARDEAYARTHILPQFGASQLASIDRLQVEAWIASLSRKLAPATVHKVHQIVGKIMRSAVDNGLLAISPCERVRLPRIEKQEMRFLTPAEVATLADAIDPRFRAFVILGAYGGLRLGEMLGLRAGRVDLLRRRVDVAEIQVEVRGHLTNGPPKTAAGRRTVPIPRVVAESLAPHVEGVQPGELVFTAPEGGPLRGSLFRRRQWAPALRAAGMGHLRIHDLRHTAVALWIAAGASPNEIARRAGHRSVNVVLDRYGHLLPGVEERVTDALDDMAADALDTAQVIPLRASDGP